MSEIDADLYGGRRRFFCKIESPNSLVDLYGADDNDFASATETAQDLAKLEEQEDVIAPSKPAALEPIIPKQTPYQVANSEPQPIQTKPESPPPTTQQIPTYQQQIPDYGDMNSQRLDGDDYQNINRPVRPSEMKEEG